MKFSGSIVALVTPMKLDGDIDYAALEKILHWQIEQGCDGIMVGGSTGEGSTLTTQEKLKLCEFAQKTVADQVPLIAYPGSNNTQASVELAKAIQDLGLKYSLLICPYYNKPTQKGLCLHFEAIANATPDMQHIIYSIPGRSVIRIENETVAKLAQIPNIIGLKDSSSTQERIRFLRSACGPDFSLLSSDDDFTLQCVQAGGDGVISVAANIVPKLNHEFVRTALQGDMLKANELHEKLIPLYKELFCQSNPIPVKALLHHMGKIPEGIRLPLTWLEPQFEANLVAAYQHAVA